jgi:hypothetical protein
MITLVVSYGYDVHSVVLDDATYAAIQSGEKISVDGQGFVHEEDGEILDRWVFNQSPGQIYFWLDNGAQFEAQDSWIEE